MINLKAREDELDEIGLFDFGINKHTNCVEKCNENLDCKDCIFRDCACFESNNNHIEWLLSEYKEPPILTDKEKEYLSAVIKPFRNRVKFIRKSSNVAGEECIEIGLGYISDITYEEIDLPVFGEGTMYKNMRQAQDYTLEELGL